MRNTKSHITSVGSMALAALLCVGATGCKSNPQHTTEVDESANLSEQNRLTVRMLQAENVYNANAVERAVYPKDFRPGSAQLNELGERRVESLIHACRDGKGEVAIVRGDEGDAVFARRIEAVRKQFVDAGFKADEISVEGGLPGGERVSSDRAIIAFARMMDSYAPGTTSDGTGSSTNGAGPSGLSGSSNSQSR